MMYNYGYYYSPFHFLGSFIGWLVFFLIILFVIRLVRKDRFMDKMHKHGFGGTFLRDPAMDLLRERYAKGEINKEEFEAKKKDLSS